MFSNYLKSALRNLSKYKAFTLINMTGLALGFACCLIIFLFIQDELSYDDFHTQGDQIYRVVNHRTSEGRHNYNASTPPAYGPTLERVFPEVLQFVRLFNFGEALVAYEDKRLFQPHFILADSTVFDVFTFPLVQGNPQEVLRQPYSLVISQRMAKKFFEDENPIGKTLTVYGTMEFQVTGVMEDLPSHSHLEIECIGSFDVLKDMVADLARLENWIWQQFYTYVILPRNHDPALLEAKLPALLEEYAKAELTHNGIAYRTELQPLRKIHLHSAELEYDMAKKGNINHVYALTFTALFSLLIACFNYMNLSTARSVQRAKEVGVRKTIGAQRFQLMRQFLSESLLLTLLSLAAAIVLASLALPTFNQWTGKMMSLQPLADPIVMIGILVFVLFVSAIAGSYPAMFLSSFKPVKVLKGQVQSGSKGAYVFRKILVLTEFAICSVFIIGSVIIFGQVQYLQDKNLGFEKEQLIVLPLRNEAMQENHMTVKSTLLQHANILSATASYGVPGGAFAGDGIMLPGKEGEMGMNMFMVDPDYIPTMGMEVIAGRNFSDEFATDTAEAFIINETAVRQLGWGTPEEALGKEIHWNKWGEVESEDPVKKGKVVGVVKDFHYKSLHQKIEPVVLNYFPAAFSEIIVRVNPSDLPNTLDFIKRHWSELAPDWPFDYTFLDQQFAAKYQAEQTFGNIFGAFTFFTIFIACLGLFGLVSFAAQQRTKEIGIRRVMGASVFNITSLLSRDFLKLVMVGILLATPIAWYAMHQWLESFAYRVSISWWVFPLTGGMIMLIALLTVSLEGIKAAMSDPVKSLRSE